MVRNILFWVLAFIFTLAIAIYQRATGPTYPLKGGDELNGSVIAYNFERTHGGFTDHPISVASSDTSIQAVLYWKRYKTFDRFTADTMKRNNDTLTASLPAQPPAGKLEYYVKIVAPEEKILPSEDEHIVLRYKGEVPLSVLIPHVIAMFGAMLLSTRTGLEIFSKKPKLRKYTLWTIGFLLIGGLILGPIVQKYAFDAYWTGFPFGHDLTDNKTLIAAIGWIIALFMYKRSPNPKRWAAFASILLLIVYLIPHSVLGSELDYEKMDAEKTTTEISTK